MLGSLVMILLMLMCITYPVTDASSQAVKDARAWEIRSLKVSVKILVGSIVGLLLIWGIGSAYIAITMNKIVGSM